MPTSPSGTGRLWCNSSRMPSNRFWVLLAMTSCNIPGPVLDRRGRSLNPRDEADHMPHLPRLERRLRAWVPKREDAYERGFDKGFKKGLGYCEVGQSE